MTRWWMVWLLPLVLAAAPAAAQERPSVVVTPDTSRSFRAAVQNFAERSVAPDAARPGKFREELERALEFSGVFQALDHAAFLGPETTPALDGVDPPVCSDWGQIGADALVEGELAVNQEVSVEFRLWDVGRCSQLARREGSAGGVSRAMRVDEARGGAVESRPRASGEPRADTRPLAEELGR